MGHQRKKGYLKEDQMEERKLKLYIETSLFGFYYDEKPVNLEKRESVRTLFEQIRQGKFQKGCISGLTLLELRQAEGELREQLLRLIEKYGLEEIEVEPEAVQALKRCYIREIPILRHHEYDAEHIATATVFEADVMVTLNCKHIVNERTTLKVEGINRTKGYRRTMDIRRPEEVILYED